MRAQPRHIERVRDRELFVRGEGADEPGDGRHVVRRGGADHAESHSGEQEPARSTDRGGARRAGRAVVGIELREEWPAPAHFFRVSSTLPLVLVVANVFSSSLSMVRSTDCSLSPNLKVRTILVPSIL